uniref:Rhodanese domain-containing protein n=1 Tax=Heterorhabditis bacteriophora TaxID=37862 RepID=A0A1I7XA30_HETBA
MSYSLTKEEIGRYSRQLLISEIGVSVGFIFIICHRGNDSQLAVEMLRDKLSPIRVKDIQGGYEAWASEVNPQFPTY